MGKGSLLALHDGRVIRRVLPGMPMVHDPYRMVEIPMGVGLAMVEEHEQRERERAVRARLQGRLRP